MAAYYNEIDPFAAQWLRNLIGTGLIAPGDVDERSIVDVRADDLKGYRQCHFFAGIGIWSAALRQAGWSDDRPVWTGSCPCQPLSAAGKGLGTGDARHLWPNWFELIKDQRPIAILGEQVASPDGLAWLDIVCSDLENEGYPVWPIDLCAAGFGAPHIRQRLWFVAYPDGGNAGAEGLQRGGQYGQQPQDGRAGELGHAAKPRSLSRSLREIYRGEEGPRSWDAKLERPGPANGFWSDAEWLYCTDDKWRPTKPGVFPLAHGYPKRMGILRAAGNAINQEAAAAFILAADAAISADD